MAYGKKRRSATDLEFTEVLNILERITGLKPLKWGGGWRARCPVHADSNPSLLIKEGSQSLMLTCLAGCRFTDVAYAIGEESCGYNPDELEPLPPEELLPPWERPIAATYVYTDEKGKPLAQKVRFADHKSFAIRHYNRGRWKWGLGNVCPPLYNLQKIINAKIIAIVEGEKDADNLTALGLPATCTILGAGKGALKWKDEYTTYLTNKHVLIFADNDEAGIVHADNLYDLLPTNLVLSKTKMYPLPGLTHKMDVSNWIELGNTAVDLHELWKERRGGSISPR